MNVPYSKLYLTDGITRINLLSPKYGLKLKTWEPAKAQFKGGGIVQSSVLSDGQRLAYASYDNVVETFVLNLAGATQPDAIREMRRLRAMMIKAVSYWLDDAATEPVWIEAQSPQETVTRYAYVYNYGEGNDPDPYQEPFWSAVAASAEDFSLTIERGHWMDKPYHENTALPLTGLNYSDAYGNTDGETTAAGMVFVGNHEERFNIEYIFYYDASLAAFSANLVGAVVPFDLLPPAPGDGDIIYFGANAATPANFDNLIFDLDPGITYGAGDSGEWQYYNGAWVAVPTPWEPYSTAQPLDATGINTVHWDIPADQVVAVINAVNTIWIRLVITEATAVTTPTQQNRGVYFANWPSVRFAEENMIGDIPLPVKIRIKNQSGDAGNTNRGISGFYLSYIEEDKVATNATNPWRFFIPSDNPIGANTALVPSSITPYGYYIQWAPAGVTALGERCQFAIANSTIFKNRVGRYHVFIRYDQTAGADGDIYGAIYFNVGANSIFSDTYVFNDTITGVKLLDMGIMDFSSIMASSLEDGYAATVSLYLGTAGAVTIRIYDLVMMPIDRFCGKYTEPSEDLYYALKAAIVNAVDNPKNPFDAYIVRDDAPPDLIYETLEVNSATPSFATQGQAGRYYFLFFQESGGYMRAPFEITASVQMYTKARYISLRGDT